MSASPTRTLNDQLLADFHRGADGRDPRAHQLEAVGNTVRALGATKASSSFLYQHAAGSGKSLTIALLVLQLLRQRPGYACVVVVNDRRQLDDQLGEILQHFLGTRHGKRVRRVTSVDELTTCIRRSATQHRRRLRRAAGSRKGGSKCGGHDDRDHDSDSTSDIESDDGDGSDGPEVIVTTLQKFNHVSSSPSDIVASDSASASKRRRRNGSSSKRVAIVVDEVGG
jgi:type I site-specific restriction-modification system R (restriction) subunit